MSCKSDDYSPGVGKVRPAGQQAGRGPYICSPVRAGQGPAGRTQHILYADDINWCVIPMGLSCYKTDTLANEMDSQRWAITWPAPTRFLPPRASYFDLFLCYIIILSFFLFIRLLFYQNFILFFKYLFIYILNFYFISILSFF